MINRYKNFLTLIFFICFMHLGVQAKKIEGKIIFEDHEVKVMVEVPFTILTNEIRFEKLQRRVIVYDSLGKKKIITPGEAKEVQFKVGNQVIRMLSVKNTLGLGNILLKEPVLFLKLEVSGYMKLYNYYYVSSGQIGSVFFWFRSRRFVLQRGNEDLKWPQELFFQTDMAEYLKDCPFLAEKIRNKEYLYKNLGDIVFYYNMRCN